MDRVRTDDGAHWPQVLKGSVDKKFANERRDQVQPWSSISARQEQEVLQPLCSEECRRL